MVEGAVIWGKLPHLGIDASVLENKVLVRWSEAVSALAWSQGHMTTPLSGQSHTEHRAHTCG